MTPKLRSTTRIKGIMQNTLIKITDYEKCIASSSQEVNGVDREQVYLQLNSLAVITQDPGHRFGNPAYYYDINDDDSEVTTFSSSSSLDDSQESAALIVNQSAMDYSFMSQRRPFVSESQELNELYYCNYQIRDKPIDSKVPDYAWEPATDGLTPGPKCRWIPAGPEADSDAKDTARQQPQAKGRDARNAAPSPPTRTSSFNAFAAFAKSSN